MSRGLGRVERSIMRELRRDPEGAFTCEELCLRIYGVPPEAKHRSSVLRAMNKLADKEPTVAPLHSMRGIGSAIYRSGSDPGRRVALAKLGLAGVQKRFHTSELSRDDEAWLVWPQFRKVFQRHVPRQELMDSRVLKTIEEIQSRYGLRFADACALLASRGFLDLRGNRQHDEI